MRLWISGPRLGGFRISAPITISAPRGRDPAPAGAFVYVIERADNGHVKIGVSNSPNIRRDALQTGSSAELRVAYSVFAGDSAYEVERGAHSLLFADRLQGEWFNVSAEAAIASVYAAAARLGVSFDDLARDEYPRFFDTFRGKVVLLVTITVLLAIVSHA